MTDLAAPDQIFQLPTRIPPMPLPTALDFDIVNTPAGQQVAMRIQDPGGVKIVLFSPEDAKRVGEQMRNAGTRASLGLVIPSARLG